MKTYRAITCTADNRYGPAVVVTIGQGGEYATLDRAHDAVVQLEGVKSILRWERPHGTYGERVWIPL